LSAGSYTPLAHLLVHVPLFRGERLQNRNAALLDLALAVLLAFFVDDLLHRRLDPARDVLFDWSRRVLGLVPVAAAVGIVAYAWASPLSLQKRLHVAIPTPGLFAALNSYLIPALATAAAIGLFVAFGHRLRGRLQSVALGVLLLADLGIYSVEENYATAPVSSFGKSAPEAGRLAALDGRFGRYALFDPIFQEPPGEPQAVDRLGLTDLNVLQENASVAGYGSAVSGIYQNVTGTHQLEYLDQSRLAGASFDTLDLRTLLTLPVYFGEDIPAHSPIPVAGASPVTADGLPGPLSGVPGPPPMSSGPWVLEPGATADWVLSTPQTVLRVTVVVNPQLDGLPRFVRVAVGETKPSAVPQPDARSGARGAPATGGHLAGRGVASGLAVSPRYVEVPVVHGQAHITFPAQRANTVLVTNPGRATAVVGAVVVVTQHPSTRVLLDGVLQGALSPPHWSYAGSIDGFSAWSNARSNGIAWLQPVTDQTPDARSAAAAGSVDTSSRIGSRAPVFVVNSDGTQRLVWSEAYARGWTARLEPLRADNTVAGVTRVVATQPFGLVQTVRLPAGRYRVLFSYGPRSVTIGLVLTLASGAVLLLLLLVFAAWHRFVARAWQRRI
jgi:hypothetical protein